MILIIIVLLAVYLFHITLVGFLWGLFGFLLLIFFAMFIAAGTDHHFDEDDFYK